MVGVCGGSIPQVEHILLLVLEFSHLDGRQLPTELWVFARRYEKVKEGLLAWLWSQLENGRLELLEVSRAGWKMNFLS